jgi:hypothetical protein
MLNGGLALVSTRAIFEMLDYLKASKTKQATLAQA